MVFRPIFHNRAVPGWTQKRNHGAYDTAQMKNKGRCPERELPHVILHANNQFRSGQMPRLSIVAVPAPTGIAPHPIAVGPVEAIAAKLKFALDTAHP